MATISEESKRAIDALSEEELLLEVNLGNRSRFQRERFAYVKTRLKTLEDLKSASHSSTFSILGATFKVSRSLALGIVLVGACSVAWWNWEEVAKRLGIRTPAVVLEGEIAALDQSWKLCVGTTGMSVCDPGQVYAISRRAESLLAQATLLSGEDRRDLVSKATIILDATRKYVKPYPYDGKIPQFKDVEDLKRGK